MYHRLFVGIRPPAAIRDALIDAGIAAKTDLSGTSVGRKYARFDGIGVPFGVTVDSQTTQDGTVTLRERDSLAQVRLPRGDVVAVGAEAAAVELAVVFGRGVDPCLGDVERGRSVQVEVVHLSTSAITSMSSWAIGSG